MTDQELMQWAEAAELAYREIRPSETVMCAHWKEDVDLLPYLRRFAAAVQAAARERYAELAENMAQNYTERGAKACEEVARMIRRA